MMRVGEGVPDAVAIAGIPGSGKSTLAAGLSDRLGWPVLSTGDIARKIDPASIAAGGVADPPAFARAFLAAYREAKPGAGTLILDGIPRYREQIDLLPERTVLIGLTCRPDIAIERQIRRARPGDDDVETVRFRTNTQAGLLEVDIADGWLYRLAGWGAVVNTSRDLPDVITAQVVAYLTGQKKQAF